LVVLNLLNYFRRPEYIWRPRQVIRRFSRIGKKPSEIEDVTLPWGAEIRVRTEENVGADIYYYGIFDPIVPEAIWRLLDSGETAVDVGANIGQNASVMAFRAAVAGCVIAFEPHPITFEELQRNVTGWGSNHFASIHLENVALGSEDGQASLAVTGYVSGARLTRGGNGVKVPVRRLDNFLQDKKTVGVCKIDVEGNELDVLQGAEQTLRRRGIRDIIFEDFLKKPSPVTELLSSYSFTIYELHKSWLKPCLVNLKNGRASRAGFSYNYLATLEPTRVVARFRSPGWKCLMSF
jgi:FkbM family methyltransferase